MGGGYAVGEVPDWSKAPVRPCHPRRSHDEECQRRPAKPTWRQGPGQFRFGPSDAQQATIGAGAARGYAGRVFEYVVPKAPHAGYCLAAGRFLLVIDAALQPRIPQLWPTLARPDARLEDVFALLASRGVSTMPPFALGEIVDPSGGEVRALVHGEAVAQPIGESMARISGTGLATWKETRWERVDGLMLGLGGSRPGLETLPVSSGVVRADWIRWQADPATPEMPHPDAPPAGIRIGDGPVLALDLPIVLGRAPDAGLTEAGTPTVPVAVPSPRRLVSATHLLIERLGDAVHLTDLGAKNGSRIEVPGEAPIVLAGGTIAIVPIGTRIDLGDGVIVEVTGINPDAP